MKVGVHGVSATSGGANGASRGACPLETRAIRDPWCLEDRWTCWSWQKLVPNLGPRHRQARDTSDQVAIARL